MADPIYTPVFTSIKEGMTQTFTLGTEWLIPLALALVVMAFITRDIEKWKILALPIFTMERMIGMPVHFIIMSISAIFFILEVMSTQLIGNIIRGVKKVSRTDYAAGS